MRAGRVEPSRDRADAPRFGTWQKSERSRPCITATPLFTDVEGERSEELKAQVGGILAPEDVAAGLIEPAEAREHPARHIITRSVGMRPAPAVDLWVLPQTPGERFLLCSDGLTSELDDDQIAAVLAAHPDAGEAAEALIAAVLATPARDNVTVLVVDVRSAEDGAGDEITVPRTVLEGER